MRCCSFRTAFGLILLGVGVIALMNNFNIFWWLRWHYLWPAILIVIGLLIVFSRGKR